MPKLSHIQRHLRDFSPNSSPESTQSTLSRVLNALEELVIEPSVSQSAKKRRKDCFLLSSEPKPVEIFNFKQPYDAIRLKSKLLASELQSCVVKLASNHYVALVTEPKTASSSCLINVIDSNPAETSVDQLAWLQSNLNNCSYKLNRVKCPTEQPEANNSLLHAFVNAAAAKWALKNNYWQFLKQNLYRQSFSHSRNIELLKKVTK